MKLILKFILWYLLMWICLIPINWYFIGYLNADFEYTKLLSLLFSSLFLLTLILSQDFRWFIWTHLSFFYNLLGEIEEYFRKRKLEKMKKKKYVFIKENIVLHKPKHQ